jgi:hypothetical protein
VLFGIGWKQITTPTKSFFVQKDQQGYPLGLFRVYFPDGTSTMTGESIGNMFIFVGSLSKSKLPLKY